MIKFLRTSPKIRAICAQKPIALHQLHWSFSTKKFAEDIDESKEQVLDQPMKKILQPSNQYRPPLPPIEDDDSESTSSSEDESDDDFLTESSSDDEDFKLHQSTGDSRTRNQ